MIIPDQIKELHELEKLTLPDGKPAKTARWHEVQRALKPVLGDDFDEADGKQALLRKYRAKLKAEQAANPVVAAEEAFADRRDARRRKESHNPRQPLRSPSVAAVAGPHVPRVSARVPE